MIDFIKSRLFLKNLVIALVLAVLLIWGVLKFISGYTLHGEVIKVPELIGKTEEEVKSIIEEQELRYTVIDSIFDLKKKKGAVLDQNPSPGVDVKRNRMIYITMNAFNPPKVQMPNLIDASLRQALSMLESYGLELGDTSRQPDYARDAVLKQLFKGRIIKPGDMLLSGSRIDLVLGDGKRKGEKVSVPNLMGLTKDEAERLLRTSGLTVGNSSYDETVKDSLTARVYKQSPAFSEDNLVTEGSNVDLYFTQDKSKLTRTENNASPE